MTKTEAQSRQEIIDKRLARAGWDVKNLTQVTSELDIWVGLPEGVKEPEHYWFNFEKIPGARRQQNAADFRNGRKDTGAKTPSR